MARGRPAGSRNVLPAGMRKALKGYRRSLDGVPKATQELVLEARAAAVKVMREEVSPGLAFAVLKGAAHVQDDALGPQTQRIEIDASLTLEALVIQATAQVPAYVQVEGGGRGGVVGNRTRDIEATRLGSHGGEDPSVHQPPLLEGEKIATESVGPISELVNQGRVAVPGRVLVRRDGVVHVGGCDEDGCDCPRKKKRKYKRRPRKQEKKK